MRSIKKRGNSFPYHFMRRVAGVALLLLSAGPARPQEVVALASAQTGRARQVNTASPGGEVMIVLNEQLLNSVLEAMLSLARPPSFPLSRRSGAAAEPAPETNRRGGETATCASEVTLARETGGVRTAVRFTEGRISAPVAFRGSYDAAFLGCVKFEGWAETNISLAFDQSQQILTARINVRSIQLNNLPSLLTSGITDLVQDAIDKRVNPVELLRAERLAASIPITPRGGGANSPLRLRAREVRHEVVQKELRLRIIYEIVHTE